MYLHVWFLRSFLFKYRCEVISLWCCCTITVYLIKYTTNTQGLLFQSRYQNNKSSSYGDMDRGERCQQRQIHTLLRISAAAWRSQAWEGDITIYWHACILIEGGTHMYTHVHVNKKVNPAGWRGGGGTCLLFGLNIPWQKSIHVSFFFKLLFSPANCKAQ